MIRFDGFPPDAWAFLRELEADNTTAYFAANRQRYDDGIDRPAKALVESLAAQLPRHLGLAVRAEPKTGRSLFRINRDTRFATDKTPYKTHIDFLFWTGKGPPRSQPAFIMRLTSATLLVGGGRIGLTAASLDTYRIALDDPHTGTTIRTHVDEHLATGAALSEPTRTKPDRAARRPAVGATSRPCCRGDRRSLPDHEPPGKGAALPCPERGLRWIDATGKDGGVAGGSATGSALGGAVRR